MIGRVGEALGLQAQTGAGAVDRPLLAGQPRRNVVAGVELDAGTVCPDRHFDPAPGAPELRRRAEGLHVGVDDVVVVEAPCQPQLLVGRVDPLADPDRSGQIHDAAADGPDGPGGDGLVVRGGEALGVEADPVLQNGAAALAVQVEIAVVGGVAEGVPVADGPVFHRQAPALQPIAQFEADLPGDPAQAVGVDVLQAHCRGGLLRHRPELRVQAGRAAVEAVAPVIRR